MGKKKLNILHLDSEKSWRGGQQQVFYLHNGLVAAGIKSILVGNKKAKIIERCKKDNLPYYELSMIGEFDVLAAFKLSKLCKKESINILQAHSAHALSIGILTKLFFPSLILVGVRRVDFSINKNIFSQLKYSNKRVNKIICISDYIKKVLISDGIDSGKLVTIRSGADISKFDKVIPSNEFRVSMGVKNGECLIGTVAAFAGHKDYPNLLKAFSIVLKKYPNTKLCIVGDGPLKNKVYSIAEELKIIENIIFTGFVNNVGEYLNSFDIFVLASKKEGLGTSIIDALSVGLPVVTTRSGGIPELINNDKNGILVEPKNPEYLAEAIMELLINPEKRLKLGKYAKESSKQFSVDETVKQNICEYNRLLDEKNI